jgi:hypothetical protein
MIKVPYAEVTANYNVDEEQASRAADTVIFYYDEDSARIGFSFIVDKDHDYTYYFPIGDLLNAIGEAVNRPDEN